MLGRAMHDHVAAVLRQRQCGMSFEVEVFLRAYLDRTLDDMLGCGERGFDVTLEIDAWPLLESTVRGERVVY